jgi:hypothetical protein
MTGADRSGDRDLTGVWSGLYSYPDGRSTSFVATLIDSGGALSGTTHEPSAGGATLYASLGGSRRDAAVAFTKIYQRPDRDHRQPIVYEGALNGDGTEIEGRWTILSVWSGKFLMIRSAGRAAMVSRKKFERA